MAGSGLELALQSIQTMYSNNPPLLLLQLMQGTISYMKSLQATTDMT